MAQTKKLGGHGTGRPAKHDRLIDSMNQWKHRAIVATGLSLAVIGGMRMVGGELAELFKDWKTHSMVQEKQRAGDEGLHRPGQLPMVSGPGS
jgi:hypothetical protein